MTFNKQKITPHLWFDREAVEAAEFYTSVFPDSQVTSKTTLHDTPSGSADVVSFELSKQAFMAISAGPIFKFNPSISFQVERNSMDEIDAMWGKLSMGGNVLMELGEYPFSEKFGWIEDRYGLSWQVMFVGEDEQEQSIKPMLLFVGDVCGKTEEAINFYTSIFAAMGEQGTSKIENVVRYGESEEPDQEGTIKYAAFKLLDQEFRAMDSAHNHNFGFNEAISLMVYCDSQEEIDYFWEKLSAVPEAEQCGWLKDKYGLSWQIVPVEMDEMMARGTKEQIERVTQKFLAMKKFDLEQLRNAYAGEIEKE
jgi:predicted 3-demethylubiquinone-9 3-methyltransferase (glyoxalase superfamily)